MAETRPRLRLRRTDRQFGTDPDGHLWTAWGLCEPGAVSDSACLLCGKDRLAGGWVCLDVDVDANVCDDCVVVGDGSEPAASEAGAGADDAPLGLGQRL